MLNSLIIINRASSTSVINEHGCLEPLIPTEANECISGSLQGGGRMFLVFIQLANVGSLSKTSFTANINQLGIMSQTDMTLVSDRNVYYIYC